MEQKGLDPRGIALLGVVALYLTAKPDRSVASATGAGRNLLTGHAGPLQGIIDMYVSGPIQQAKAKVYTKEDIRLGRKVATGGFGTVYRGQLREAVNNGQRGAVEETTRDVIIKKAQQFGEAEAWMNERLSRAAPGSCAEFITAFGAPTPRRGQSPWNSSEEVWLMWQYEGDSTIADLMVSPAFPYNMEELLFGRKLALPDGAARKQATIRLAMQQLLENLDAMHSCGIVHRDIKPQNCILSTQDRRVKLIDLGAAADLRVGINYVPNEYLLDPRYAPPEQYVMSTQTPRAPPAPVADLLSPVLWRLNNPDRFDMYSAGLVLMQMSFPALRSDSNLIAFNRRLEDCGYDLDLWRRQLMTSKTVPKDLQEGFDILDFDNGAGWRLVRNLVRYEPRSRLSAGAALADPWFQKGWLTDTVRSAVSGVTSAFPAVDSWLPDALSADGRGGWLTEAQLSQTFGDGYPAPRPPTGYSFSNTISWWQNRQVVLQRKLRERKQQDQQAEIGRASGRNGTPAKAGGKAKPAAKPELLSLGALLSRRP